VKGGGRSCIPLIPSCLPLVEKLQAHDVAVVKLLTAEAKSPIVALKLPHDAAKLPNVDLKFHTSVVKLCMSH
jgi:hypothetical protein